MKQANGVGRLWPYIHQLDECGQRARCYPTSSARMAYPKVRMMAYWIA